MTVVQPAATTTPTSTMWRGLLGLLLSGLILALPGALLPHWSFHLTSEYTVAGAYFLCLYGGLLVALQTGRALLRNLGVRPEMILASCVALLGFVGLSFAAPPAPAFWAQAALAALGFAAGLLVVGVFQLIANAYQQAPAATFNLSGILFGLGCLLVALLMAWHVGTAYPWMPFAICAGLAAVTLFWYARRPFAAGELREDDAAPGVRVGWTTPSAILIALLLFFQFGSEWAVAGWLPLFLIQRLGISPEAGLEFLALYWAALVVGRIAAQVALRQFSHTSMLLGSVFGAAFGAIILTRTNSAFGAATGIVVLGGAFSVTFPLIVEKARTRFTDFHPVYLKGVFSIALAGALVAPWLVGQLATHYGIVSAMVVPVVGTLAVFVLQLLVWLDARLNSPH